MLKSLVKYSGAPRTQTSLFLNSTAEYLFLDENGTVYKG